MMCNFLRIEHGTLCKRVLAGGTDEASHGAMPMAAA
jgi:hypothetical protein